MLECPYCGGEIEDDGLDCPHCGADIKIPFSVGIADICLATVEDL